MGFDHTGGIAGDGGVDGHGPGVEQIEGPNVQSAASQVYARGCLGFDSQGHWQCDRSYLPAPPLARLRTSKGTASFFWAWAGFGSKHRRQRASYMPFAPTTMSSSLSTRRCVCPAGFPQRTQIASSLVISSAMAS